MLFLYAVVPPCPDFDFSSQKKRSGVLLVTRKTTCSPFGQPLFQVRFLRVCWIFNVKMDNTMGQLSTERTRTTLDFDSNFLIANCRCRRDLVGSKFRVSTMGCSFSSVPTARISQKSLQHPLFNAMNRYSSTRRGCAAKLGKSQKFPDVL